MFIRVFPQTVNCQTVTLRTDVIDLFHDILYLSKIFLAKQLLKQDFPQRFLAKQPHKKSFPETVNCQLSTVTLVNDDIDYG